MEYAKLIMTFNAESLSIIHKWEIGEYNVRGFNYAKEDIGKLFLIKFYIENYNDVKHNKVVVNKLTKPSQNMNVSLSFEHFKKIDYGYRNYNKSIDSISSKLSLNYDEKDYYFHKNKNNKVEIFTYDIVNTPSFKVASIPPPPKSRIIKY